MLGEQAKKILEQLPGGQILGAIDYWRHPEMRSAWGGPFNGQRARAALFLALIATVKARAIIETGTFRGTTTEFMARTGLPIYTVENQARNYGFSRARLFGLRNVDVHHGDSRRFIRKLLRGPLGRFTDQVVFAYLDAHGEGDLPLAEEIDLLFTYWPAAVVMIDDFEVPFDAGYRFDIYRSGKALNWAYIEPEIVKHDLAAFYPATAAAQETGKRRGCIVLAKKARHAEAISAMRELRTAHG
jgi:hypothetical protein